MHELECVKNIVSRVSKYWNDDKKLKVNKILKAFERMDVAKINRMVRKEVEAFLREEVKIKECLDKTNGDFSKCGNPVQMFVEWLDSPSGLVAFTYMWKPKFAELIMRIISTSLVLSEKLVKNILGVGVKGRS